MRLNLLIFLLNLANLGCASISETGCESIPLPNDNPDKSGDDDPDVYVKCEGDFTDISKLKPMLENITYPISVFELRNAVLDVLPNDMFHDVRKPSIRKVVFRNVTMSLIQIPELGRPPFKSVKDTVESLEISDCKTVFAWDLKSLKFEKLRTVIIENSDVYAVTDSFKVWPLLQFIQLTHSSIQVMDNYAFKENKKLTLFSLAYNKLSHISRKLLPKPAAFLYSIDLSYNNLYQLPDDMFTDMDMLHEIKLDNNKFRSISFDVLKPVWNTLTQLWLSDNSINCRGLCWLADENEKPMFLESSNCETRGKKMFIDESLQDC